MGARSLFWSGPRFVRLFTAGGKYLIYFQDGRPPAQLTVYPREDLRVFLSDHKIALAEVGFEQQDVKEPARYYQALGPRPGAWWRCTWNTPLRVRGRGDTILLADSRVDDHKDFEIHAPHMMSSDVPMSSNPRYTVDSLARRTNNSPEDQLLDFDTQITVMVWLKVRLNVARVVYD